jgi:MFS family permease
MIGSVIARIYVAKAARVYVSGMLSILIPFYLAVLGYSAVFVGLALVAILAGNAFSNIALSYFERRLGRRRFLMVFSLLMVISGLALALGSGAALILAACFLGNISTTGTEAGPFQSVEAGILPDLTKGGSTSKAFGVYNLIGYLASSAGAFTASAPDFLGGGLVVYRGLFGVFAAAGVLLLVIYGSLTGIEAPEAPAGKTGLSGLDPLVKQEVVKLSALFSADAFGGSFVSQYVLTYWFHVSYGADLALLGSVFLATNLISALSVYGAAAIANKLGNLRTMFSSHMISNLFLLLIPFAGSLWGSLVFLFLRQSTSQMDVPTRQAFMGELFGQKERVTAFAITNTARSLSAFAGGPVSTLMFAMGLLSGPILAGGLSKVAYDIAIFGTYRKRYR